MSVFFFFSVAEQCMLHITSVKTVDVQKTKHCEDEAVTASLKFIHGKVKDLFIHWQERLDLCSWNCCVRNTRWRFPIRNTAFPGIFHLQRSPYIYGQGTQHTPQPQLTAGPLAPCTTQPWHRSPASQCQGFTPERHGKEIMFPYLLACMSK